MIDDEKVKNAVILGISLGEEWTKISLREAVKKASQKDKRSKFQPSLTIRLIPVLGYRISITPVVSR